MPRHPNPSNRLRMAAGEQGSVVMALLVMLVVTRLVIAVLATTEIGLRGARRAGDSANALQLADAGINDAAKAITAHTSSFTGTSAAIKGTADSYTGPTNTCSTMPASGVIGSNGTITFTGGTGIKNCRGAAGWAYPVDGCTFYGQTTIPPDGNGNNAISAGACPPAPATTTTSQKFYPHQSPSPAA